MDKAKGGVGSRVGGGDRWGENGDNCTWTIVEKISEGKKEIEWKNNSPWLN